MIRYLLPLVVRRLNCAGRTILLIGHLNNGQSRDFPLSKNECQRILQGYPPFYRERVQTYQGGQFPYPEMANGGIRRGGWVVAVAFSRTLPTAAYIAQQYSNGNGFHSSCCRVRDVITKVIKRGFLTSLSIESACRSLERMCNERSGSAYPEGIDCPDLQRILGEKSFRQITTEQCAFAVDLFNGLDSLTVQQTTTLRPLLIPILAAAVTGVCEVYQYVNNQGCQMEQGVLDLFLKNPTIYLEDCT